MAYDETLAERLREALAGERGVSEKKIFGGLAFLLDGHLAVAASGRGGLMLRCDPARGSSLAERESVEPVVMRGREMAGWLYVAADVIGTDAALREWVDVGVSFTRTLAAEWLSISAPPVRRTADQYLSAKETDMPYADVNGLHMYYETHGSGSPLVLLHGGMLTIDLNFATLLPALAERHQVIAVETQGHGRTADIDRAITPAAIASDIVALLDELGVDRAHVLGHSAGAATALELAVSHPQRVLSVVPISASVRPDGMHPDLNDPSTYATSTRMPTQQDFTDFAEAYANLSPHPEKFDEFLTKMSSSAADLQGWTDDQLAAITAPVLIVQGDHDFVTVEHAALMQQLIPGSRLAVLPGTTHMQVTRRADYLLPMLADFLD